MENKFKVMDFQYKNYRKSLVAIQRCYDVIQKLQILG